MMKKFLATFLISIFVLFLNVGFCGPIGGGPIGHGGNDEGNIVITGGTIDGAVIGGTTPAAGSFTTLEASTDPVDGDGVGDRDYNDNRYLLYNNVIIVTDDDIILTSSHFGKSVRMSSAADHIAFLPSVGASDDGAKLRICKIGAGKVTVDVADLDKINDSGAGDTIYNDLAAEIYAFIDLEYVHVVVTWVVTGTGTWVTTN